MENYTFPPFFYFTMFDGLGNVHYLYFCLGLIFYCAILVFNVIILLVICLDPALHQPMYLLISCLSLNSLYGTAALFPRLLRDLLSDWHSIARSECFTQLFVIYTYASFELTTLTLMAYDRYVAICKPLQYHSIMTPKVLSVMIAFAWIYPIFLISICLYLSVQLPLCGSKVSNLYCNNWSVVKLSCIDTSLNNIVGLFVAVTLIFFPVSLILYSYAKILRICLRSSSEVKSKAFHTCLPHIITFVNYSVALFCDITLARLEPGALPQILVVIFSLEFLIIPPVLNPLVYGLNFPDIRKKIQQLLNLSK